MSDWWTVGYPGAPMVGPPFIRALYPPDAAAKGKTPSSPGKDVEAVKRTVSRLGRWEWQTFDREFSNGFSHGKGPNVIDTGLAGVQRQLGLDPSGWMGEPTYNGLRSARIPAPLPHAGEYGMDATAIRLLEEFAAEQHDPREKAMEHLEARAGYTEQPPDSNCDSRSDGIRTAQDHCAGGGTWLRYQPWCGCWAYYALEAGGVQGMDSSLASVASIEDNAKAARLCFRGWTTDHSKTRPGDLVVIGGYGVHVEIVRGKRQADGGLPTWGGNTSAGSSGSQSNGGGAYARVRYPSEIRGYALVIYPGE